MINDKIEKMINEQMNFEIYSAYIYKAMGAYCDSIDLTGFANWFKIQVDEEMFHAQKMYDFLLERGGRPFFTQIAAPPKDWDSVKAAFEHALDHERIVTDRINKIMTAAIGENDHASRSFLNWFVDEQVEEEANVDSILKKLELVKESGHGIFLMDKDLAARTFTPPTAE
ncbi:MAG: ferritin [Candidatus Aminicenantes bacterium]|nr:ferritin [Candidatus Aminicenantes bacterium]